MKNYKIAIISVLAFTVIIIITSTTATIQNLENRAKEDMGKYLGAILENTYQNIYTWAEHHARNTEILAKEITQATKKLAEESGDRDNSVNQAVIAEIREKLNPHLGDDYEDFFIIGPGNINLASARDTDTGKLNPLVQQEKTLKTLWSGKTTLSLPMLTSSFLSDSTGNHKKNRVTLFAGTPVKDESGTIIALFVLQINYLNDFAEILGRGRLGNSGDTYCVSETGKFLSTSRYSRQLKQIGLIQPGEDVILNLSITDPGVNLLIGEKKNVSTGHLPLTVMAQSLANGQSGLNLDGYRDYRGVPVIGVWKWDDRYDFGIATEIEVDEAYTKTHVIRTSLESIAFIRIIFVFGLAVLIYLLLKKLIEGRNRFLSLYENSAMGIYRTTPGGQILMANPSLVKMLGFDSFHELAERNLEKTGFADQAQRITFKKILDDNGIVTGFESEWQHKTGKMIAVSETAKAIKDNTGKVIFYDGTVEDITLRKQAENKYKHILDTAIDGFWITNMAGQLIEVNNAACNMLGYSSEEMLQMAVMDIEAIENPEETKKHIEKAITQGNDRFVSRHRRKDGAIIDVEISTQFIADNSEPVFVAFVKDITVNKRMERHLINERNFNSAILDNAGVLVIVLDREGRIRRFNRAAEKLSGFSFEEIKDRFPWDTFLPAEDADTIRTNAFEALANKHQNQKGNYTNYWVSKNGEKYLIEFSNTLLFNANGDMEYMISIGIDITEREKTKEVLQKSENLLKKSQQMSHVGSWELDAETKELTWSDETYRIFGMQPRECPVSHEMFMEMVHPGDRFAADSAFLKSLEEKQDSYEVEHRLVLKHSGGIRYVLERCEHVRDTSGKLLRSVGMVQDITEQKQAEQALKESRYILQRAQSVALMGSWRLDVLNDILEWSDETYRIFEVPANISLTYESFLSYVHPEDKEYVDQSWNDALKGKPYNIEHRIIVNGAVKWVSEKAELEIDENQQLLRGIGTVQDITEKKLAEEKIKASLAEKEVLLREIHHRVKNNLQIIGSLLYLQSLQIDDHKILRMFDESLDRIKAMGLAHEYLYQSEDLKNINIEQYLRKLVSVLKESYLEKNSNLTVEFNIKENIEFDKAVYCGLIINELVTNSIKYAFYNMQNGKVQISFEKKNDKYCLEVSDNGTGISDISSLLEGKTLGLKIVGTLTKQLKGTIEYTANGGTKAIIRFPVTGIK